MPQESSRNESPAACARKSSEEAWGTDEMGVVREGWGESPPAAKGLSKDFERSNAAYVDCPTCHGASTVDPDPDCPTCRGEGEVEAATEGGTMDRFLDRIARWYWRFSEKWAIW